MASATPIADFEAVSPILADVTAYAQRGWRVLPIYEVRFGRCSCAKAACASPGKHPRLRHGVTGATTDQSQIHRWLERWPDANFAIATGDGLVVLDVDPDKGGDESLVSLLGGDEPNWHTPTVLTGGAGRHFYFRTDARVGSRVRFRGLAGLDVRGDGGYVVSPPSNHLQGTYEWRSGYGPDIGLIDWPFADPQHPPAVAPNRAEDGPPAAIAHGLRNDTLLRFAGAMRRVGMSGEAIALALLTENDERCIPPLSVDEVIGIAQGSERYHANSSKRSVEARLGALAQLPWVPLPLVALLHRQLGLTLAEFDALLAILGRHWSAGAWGSFSQHDLAASIGVDRRTIGDQLQSLRAKGFLAVRADLRHGRTVADPRRSPTLHYCAEPYLATLAWQAARLNPLPALRESGDERLNAFSRAAQDGLWNWEVGKLSSTESSSEEMVRRFRARVGFDAEGIGTRRESTIRHQEDSVSLSIDVHAGAAGRRSRRLRTAPDSGRGQLSAAKRRANAVLTEVHAAGQS